MIVAIEGVKRNSSLDFVIFEDGICEVEVIAVRASPRTRRVYELFVFTVVYCTALYMYPFLAVDCFVVI